MTSCPVVSSRPSVLANRAVDVDADPRRAPSMGWPRSRTCATNRSGRDIRNRYSTTPYSTKGSPTLTQARSGSSSSSTAAFSATRLVCGVAALRAAGFRAVDVGLAGESTAEAVDHMYAPVSSCSPVHVYSRRPSGSRRGGRTSSNEKHRGQVTINRRHFSDPRDESSEARPRAPDSRPTASRGDRVGLGVAARTDVKCVDGGQRGVGEVEVGDVEALVDPVADAGGGDRVGEHLVKQSVDPGRSRRSAHRSHRRRYAHDLLVCWTDPRQGIGLFREPGSGPPTGSERPAGAPVVAQRPTASRMRRAVSAPEKFCWPVTRLPSRMAKERNAPAWM